VICLLSMVSNDFLTIRDWHRAVVGGKNLILRNTSALEHLQLFIGYVNEKEIEVYALQKEDDGYDNINYHIVNGFDKIDYIRIQNVFCTTPNQTFNDMLSDIDSDEQALMEGLSNYYFSNGKSFNGLNFEQSNLARFLDIRQDAIEYYLEN